MGVVESKEEGEGQEDRAEHSAGTRIIAVAPVCHYGRHRHLSRAPRARPRQRHRGSRGTAPSSEAP